MQKRKRYGNIEVRENMLGAPGEPNDHVDGHGHNFTHLTIIFTGAARVKARFPDGRLLTRDFYAPDCFEVGAGVDHEITALVPNTNFWCVFSHRNADGEIVEAYVGWEPAYV